MDTNTTKSILAQRMAEAEQLGYIPILDNEGKVQFWLNNRTNAILPRLPLLPPTEELEQETTVAVAAAAAVGEEEEADSEEEEAVMNVRGAYKNEKSNMWFSRISVNQRAVHLGTFATKEEAAAKFEYAQQLRAELKTESGVDMKQFRARLELNSTPTATAAAAAATTTMSSTERRKRAPARYVGVRSVSETSWRAKIGISNMEVHLGIFTSPEEAAKQYQKAKRIKAEIQRETGGNREFDLAEFRRRMGLNQKE